MNDSAPNNVEPTKRQLRISNLLSVLWFFFFYLAGIMIPSAFLLNGAFGIYECASWGHCQPTAKAAEFYSTTGIALNFIGPAIWWILTRLGKLPGVLKATQDKP